MFVSNLSMKMKSNFEKYIRVWVVSKSHKLNLRHFEPGNIFCFYFFLNLLFLVLSNFSYTSRKTSRLGIYPPLFTSPSGDSCILFYFYPLEIVILYFYCDRHRHRSHGHYYIFSLKNFAFSFISFAPFLCCTPFIRLMKWIPLKTKLYL